MTAIRHSRRTFLAASAALAATPAFAQTSGTTTLVVPFPPGGSTDALARLLQNGLQTRLGRTIIIENKAGAAGAIGAAAVAKGPTDGSSILVTFELARGHSGDPRKAAGRCREGSRAGAARRHRALCHCDQPWTAVQDVRRHRRSGKRETGLGEVRLRWDRDDRPSGDDDVGQEGWCRDHPRCLSGRRPCHQ